MKKLLLIILILNICSCSDKSDINYSKDPILEANLFAKGIISTTDQDEFDITFSPDGLDAYFTRRKGEEKQKIYITSFKEGNWTPPKLAFFSTDRDETPFVTPDGKTIYFGSERPIPGKESRGNFDMNIWRVSLEKENPIPKPISETINKIQIEGEKWPSSNENYIFSLDGESFYFSTKRIGTKGIGIYKTQYEDGNFSEPVRLSGFFRDEKVWLYSATLSPDGNYLFFNAYDAPGGVGGDDIFVSKKTASGWSGAKALNKKVNTASEEGNPRFSPQGKYFFFCRSVATAPEEDGISSIFHIETKALELEKLFSQ